MDVPTYWDGGSQESVCDPSRPAWASYHSLGTAGHDFTFDFTASGTYRIHFYFMDNDRNDPQNDKGIYYLRATAEVTVNDAARPSVTQIVNDAVDLCRQQTNGSEYDMALWLHDWTLDQLEYDHNLNWCSAESGLTRHQGTCESYQRIYSKLLDAAGIANGLSPATADTWNAVKIDGKWCQMDLTWDDTSDNWYGDLDQRHLYFGLTDELMAIAHSDHTANYKKDGYAYRSTDLSNNYFVRNGKADEWAEKYADRIQQHLDAREESFSIDADNQSFPPSISGIQNGIVAHAMNQREWGITDGIVPLKAAPNLTTVSNYEWSIKFVFKAEFPTAHKEGWSRLKDGSICYLKNGNLIHGEQEIDGKWYFFDQASGEMAMGFTTLPYGKRVYYAEDGSMRYGEQEIDGKWYFFDQASGEMATGFTTLPYGKRVYYAEDGSMRYGEQEIDGKWYFFDQASGEQIN